MNRSGETPPELESIAGAAPGQPSAGSAAPCVPDRAHAGGTGAFERATVVEFDARVEAAGGSERDAVAEALTVPEGDGLAEPATIPAGESAAGALTVPEGDGLAEPASIPEADAACLAATASKRDGPAESATIAEADAGAEVPTAPELDALADEGAGGAELSSEPAPTSRDLPGVEEVGDPSRDLGTDGARVPARDVAEGSASPELGDLDDTSDSPLPLAGGTSSGVEAPEGRGEAAPLRMSGRSELAREGETGTRAGAFCEGKDARCAGGESETETMERVGPPRAAERRRAPTPAGGGGDPLDEGETRPLTSLAEETPAGRGPSGRSAPGRLARRLHELPRARGTRLGAVALLSVGAGVAGLVVIRSPSEGAVELVPAPTISAERAGEAEAFDLFEEGVEAIHGRDWWGASIHFAQAAVLDPSSPEPAAYLERTQAEAGFAERAREAARCLERGDQRCAREAVDAIDPRSLVYEDLGSSLLPLLAALEGAEEEPEGRSAQPAAQRDGGRPPGGGAPKAALRPASGPRAPPGEGRAKEGRARARVKESAPAPERGEPPEAKEEGPETIARRHVQAAVRARLGGSLEKAAWHLEQAMAAAPADPEVQRELGEVRVMLPELFRVAYAGRNSDPGGAKEKLRLVIRLSAPGDDLRARAEKWLERLEAKP